MIERAMVTFGGAAVLILGACVAATVGAAVTVLFLTTGFVGVAILTGFLALSYQVGRRLDL